MPETRQQGHRWLIWVALASIAIALVILRLHSHGEPLERDLTAYAYTAHAMLNGEQLYTEVWEHKPPAIYVTYMLAETLWGYRPLAITVLGILFSLVSLTAIFLFLRTIAGGMAALLGSAFWALTSNSVLLQANQPNTEVFVNAFTMIGFFTFAQNQKSSRKWLLSVSGFSLAVGSLFKTIAVYPMMAMCVYLMLPIDSERGHSWFRRWWRECTAFLAPGLLLWLGVVVTLGVSGSLSAFYDIVFVFNRQYSGSILRNILVFFAEPSLLFHESQREIWVLVLLSIGWFLVHHRSYGPLRHSFLLLALAGILVEVAAPGRYFPHYYQLLLPMYAILSALFFSDALKRLKTCSIALRHTAVGSIVVIAMLSLVIHQRDYLQLTPEEISIRKYGRTFVDTVTLAEEVNSMTSPCETIYAFGGDPGIYYYAERSSASAVFQVIPFVHSPLYIRDTVYTRILNELKASPPALVIWNSEFGVLEESRFLDFVAENYTLVATFNTYSVFEYRNRSVAL